MDPPPPSTTPTLPTTTATTTTTTYADSVDSSPRSRATDYDDPFPPSTPKLRLMCSYGGHIVPRPHDKSLCYVGGDTRMVVVDRTSTLPDLLSRLSKTLLNGRSFTLKYQLPNEDLDSLITLSSEEDLDNMIDEYDRLLGTGSAGKSSRIRLFLFPSKPEPAQSIGSLLDGSNRSEDWFLNALNGAAELQRGFSDPSAVNSLLGLDENGNLGNTYATPDLNNHTSNNGGSTNSKEMEMLVNHGSEKSGKLGNQNNQSNPDIQSVPDSPIIETTSSFGSTSSSPSLANLPPIRVHVEEGGGGGGGGGGGVRVMEQQRVGGIEEQFAQMGVNVQKQQMDDQGFMVISSPSTGVPASMMTSVPASGGPGVVGPGGGEFANRVVSDDERSDHGGRKQQQQMGQPMMVMTSQAQQKHASGELPSPDSVSSDSSFSNVISRPKQVMYQDPNAQLPSGSNRLQANMVDPNTRIQMQQVSETGYVLPPQYDQHQLQLLQQQHQQQQHQHQQQQHQHQQQQHQQHQHQQQLMQQQHQQHQQQQHHQQQHQQQQHHQQQHQQQQQQQHQQPQNQPQAQQYIPAGAQFMHHPHPGAVPMQAYYSVYPPQQSHHPHQYPVYYVPAGQAPQGYSLPMQQQQQQPPNLGEPATSNPSTRPQTPPNPTIITPSSAFNPNRNVAPPKPEMNPGVYRTVTSAGPQLIQVPPNQPPQPPPQSQPQPQPPPQSQPQPQPPPQSQPQPHQPQPQHQQQFMGYSQIHHPSQSIAPGSAAGAGGYAYEFADPAHSQIYFTQPLAPAVAAQYNQGMGSVPAMVLPDGSQVPNENVKQQVRSSQPL